jgi:signal transduction histidine kinase
MKNVTVWIGALVVLSVGAVSTVHWKGIQESDRKVSQVQPVYERQPIIDRMTLDLEKYRRTSAIFRKMEPGEIAGVKDKLRAGFSKSLASLDLLQSTPEEKAMAAKLDEQLNTFLSMSAKIEPMLFLKDAYHSPEIVELHNGMIKSLDALRDSTQARIKALHAQFNSSSNGSMYMIEAISALIVLLFGMLLGRQYLAFGRPLRRLHEYGEKLREEKGTPQPRPGLKGLHGDVEGVLHELALTVESQRKDRHKFIQDIVDDLRAPLSMLKQGRALNSGESDEASQVRAADSVRRGLALLSGSLDDLGDILNLNRLQAQLEERVIDLTELISDTVRELSGGAVGKQIHVSAPPMPVWVLVDARRFERTLVQVVSKMAATCTNPASRLQITLSQPTQGGFRGVELLIQEVDQNGTKARLAGSGPEQDLIRHWIAENGFGMALVHKIVKAHGGSVSVSGVAGSSVAFRIRLPQDRVGSGLLSPSALQPATDGGVPAHSQPRIGLEVAPLTHATFDTVRQLDTETQQPSKGRETPVRPR